ncbi:hypothetical protein [Pseudomonas sp.]|uniref:hypothetical protein n=1 Tax=Pseudomonas sp. TaxID=306 RepID=UPI0026203F88|nr:hypothetical protein [Pseudomonas sp.]
MSHQNRTKGTYIGNDPADIFLCIGDSWTDGTLSLTITRKLYITSKYDMNYDILLEGEDARHPEKGAVRLIRTGVANSNQSYALPIPDNLDADTPEFFLTIRPGDEHKDPNGSMWKINGRTFKTDAQGVLKMELGR